MDSTLENALKIKKIYNQMAKLIVINASQLYQLAMHYHPDPNHSVILNSMQSIAFGDLVFRPNHIKEAIEKDNCISIIGRLITEYSDGKGFYCYWVERLDGELMQWPFPLASGLLSIIEHPSGYVNLTDSESWVREAKIRHKL